MSIINPEDRYFAIRSLVKSAGSHIFVAKFTKVDGTLRVMKVQDAATKFHVKGAEGDPSHRRGAETRKTTNPNLLNVYDIESSAIRSINMDTLISLTIDGKVHDFL